MKKASEAIGNRRLLKLAAFLRTVPRSRFDYSVFVGGDWAGAQDLSCGTQACALGWAATMPTFRRLGLYLNRAFRPVLKGLRDPWRSAERLFSLDREEAITLFAPDDLSEDYATPKYVASKLERFVASRAARNV